MEMRKLEKLGIETSLLGFGAMRLPNHDGIIDEEQAKRMIDYAMKNGVNYYDTAYPYHNGESEPVLGRLLNAYPRESYYLATKLPIWEVNSVEDAKRLFEEQLRRVDKDYIDFYLLHALNGEAFERIAKLGVIEYCESLKAQGKIRYFGFSFHDSYEAFEKIITYRSWDFCQIQYNYMDTDEQAGDKGYALAEQLGIPLVIMEPLKGGSLSNFSGEIAEQFKKMDAEASFSSFGLRWVASHSNVKVILSGMSSWEQVTDNVATLAACKPMSDFEMRQISLIKQMINDRVKNGCTGCRYCMPCPQGVDIPRSFNVWNTYHMYQHYSVVSWAVKQELVAEKAAKCVQCGLCETKCPQKISIPRDLAQFAQDMAHPIW